MKFHFYFSLRNILAEEEWNYPSCPPLSFLMPLQISSEIFNYIFKTILKQCRPQMSQMHALRLSTSLLPPFNFSSYPSSTCFQSQAFSRGIPSSQSIFTPLFTLKTEFNMLLFLKFSCNILYPSCTFYFLIYPPTQKIIIR